MIEYGTASKAEVEAENDARPGLDVISSNIKLKSNNYLNLILTNY